LDFSAWFILLTCVALWSLGIMFLVRLSDDINTKIYSAICIAASFVVLSTFGVYTAPTSEFAFKIHYLNLLWPMIILGYALIVTNVIQKTRLLSVRNYRLIAFITTIAIIGLELIFIRDVHEVVKVNNAFSISIAEHWYNYATTLVILVLIILITIEKIIVLYSKELSQHRKNLVRTLLLISFFVICIGVPIFLPNFLNVPLAIKLPLFYFLSILLVGAVIYYFSLFQPSSKLVRQSILRNTSNFLFIVDEGHLIKETNYKVDELLLPTSSNLLNSHIENLFPNISELLTPNNFSKRSKIYSKDYKLNVGKQKEIQVELFISPLSSNKKSSGGYLLMGNDLTKLVETQKALENYNDELEQKNEDLNNFANIVSHDLKSPLNTISGFATLIERDNKDVLSTDSLTYIDFIKTGCRNMAEIIEKLLSMAQNSLDSLDIESVHLKKIIEESLLHLSLKIEQESAQVELGNLEKVSVDRIQFIQLFQNLIENSLKYKHPHRDPMIEIRAERLASQTSIYVSDNGIGIAQDKIDSIFRKYKQIDKDAEGMGLGLATCYKIIENHQGTIDAESKVGEGTTFIISLPHQP